MLACVKLPAFSLLFGGYIFSTSFSPQVYATDVIVLSKSQLCQVVIKINCSFFVVLVLISGFCLPSLYYTVALVDLGNNFLCACFNVQFRQFVQSKRICAVSFA